MATQKIKPLYLEDVTLPEFEGTSRFSIISKLGTGGFGVVYRAFDRELNSPVAIKVLHKTDPEALYAFKQEFRALADVTHTNLVGLYELLSQDDRWFFTMELVEGLSFLDYIWEKDQKSLANDVDTIKVVEIALDSKDRKEMESLRFDKVNPTQSGTLKLVKKPTLSRPYCNYELLWDTLHQLASGINALHKAGKLHRDIKPSNVLVTTLGRVVLLDFGLVAELIDQNRPQCIVGTPLYMSPEQCAGYPLDSTSDWYSVGVMLYQVLTGRAPFDGDMSEVLSNKQQYEPLAPAELFPDIPEELNRLCWDLLRRDPAKRPSGTEILRRLRDERFTSYRLESGCFPSAAKQQALLMGRETQLQQLYGAFSRACEGKGVVALASGRSGIGKSALIRYFIDSIQTFEAETITLVGRCYEQESVPYKALDPLIDALAHYLTSISTVLRTELMKDDLGALSLLFPVLRHFQIDTETVADITSPQSLRRRAVAALCNLLTRMARVPVVIFIDDLQWGDMDSALLLEDLLDATNRPPILFIGAFRSDEEEKSPFLQRFLGGITDADRINIGELNFEEASDLSMALLAGTGADTQARAAEIAQESRGNPFFIDELVRYYRDAGERQSEITKLEDVILGRVVLLPEKAQTLLKLLAIAGQPVKRSLVRRLVFLEGEEQAIIVRLRASHLIRLIDSNEEEYLETYHDRIRETITSSLSTGEARKYHLLLAEEVERLTNSDAELLATHFCAAQELEKAVYYAILAAEKAAQTYAFGRAVQLYHMALEIVPRFTSNPWPKEKLLKLRIDLADVLVANGRAAEAAHEYLKVAQEYPHSDNINTKRLTIKLRQTAAEQLLRAGHIDDGLQVVREVLTEINAKFIESKSLAVLSLLFKRIQIKLRGFDFRTRDAQQLSTDELLKIDVFWSVAMGLGIVDIIRGTEFQARHLLLVLQVGEPYRVARALAIESGYSSLTGRKDRAHTEELIRKANALAEKIQHPHAIALAKLMSGLAAFCLGQFKSAHDLTETAERMLRSQSGNYKYELDIAELFLLRSMYYRGELPGLATNLNIWLKNAAERGDLYAVTNLTTRVAYITYLMNDQPAEGQRLVTETLARWSQQSFFMQHFFALIAQVEIALYAGDYLHGETILQAQWPKLAKSLILNIQVLRVEATHLRARNALAMASISETSATYLAMAQSCARKLEKEYMPYSSAFAALIRAGIASFYNDELTATRLLEQATSSFRELDMTIYAMAAQYRYGQTIAGKQGEAFVAEARNWFQKQQVFDTVSMVNMLAPGNWKRL